MSRRLRIGLALAAFVALAFALLLVYDDGPLFQAIPVRARLPSHALPSVGADAFYISASSIVRRGPSRVFVVRLNNPAELVPHHFKRENLPTPRPIEEWQTYLNAPIVFNAGQFDENLRHLGWLKAHGKFLSEHRKVSWKGLLVSGPIKSGAWTRVVDLQTTPASIIDDYAHAMQSMMLVDEAAMVRVRDSDLAACRTVLAEDDKGRILILVSEGAMTLADLARWLPTTNLGIVRAMNLDGGVEAQIAVQTPELKLAMYGQYGTGTSVLEVGSVGMIRFPLPAVIAVRPRTLAE